MKIKTVRCYLAGTRGSLASAGKPTSSTLASLAGLLREHSHERSEADAPYAPPSEARALAPARRERNMRAKNKDTPRQVRIRLLLRQDLDYKRVR